MTFLTVPRFNVFLGTNRTTAITVNALIKRIDSEMVSLGGKWNGHGGYDFATAEIASEARTRMGIFESEFQRLVTSTPIVSSTPTPPFKARKTIRTCCPGG